MQVSRIVANIGVADVAQAATFYRDILGLELVMDHGWIVTYGSTARATVQISFATQGGSGTPTPDLSIEVDDLELVLARIAQHHFVIEYGPVTEPWGVRRFYVRDPFGKLVNVLTHRT